MTTSVNLADELYSAPNFPELLQELNARWQAEQQRRSQFWEDIRADQKAEFINGEGILHHSPVMLKHLRISYRLLEGLMIFLRQNPIGFVGYEKVMIRLTRNDYEPDLVYWRQEVAEKFEVDQYIFPIPHFVVEILSPSTKQYDYGVKMQDYARHGIQEYWIIDPEKQTVEQYLLQGSRYELFSQGSEGELVAHAIPGFALQRQQLFMPI